MRTVHSKKPILAKSLDTLQEEGNGYLDPQLYELHPSRYALDCDEDE